jgi:hypothetical protein
MNVSTTTATTPGAANGNMTRRNAVNRLHPSTSACSGEQPYRDWHRDGRIDQDE